MSVFKNADQITIFRLAKIRKAEIIYFIRAGAKKPLGFENIHNSSKEGHVILSQYEDPEWDVPDNCSIIAGGLSKYHAFHSFRKSIDFEYVFILDADIALHDFSESRLLEKLRGLRFNCAQLSLCSASHSAFPFLKKSTKHDFRRVNFIEVMAPIFNKNSIDRVLHTFPLSLSTWGLDYAWSKIFSGNRMYVIDSEIMTHLGRPDLKDGAFYKYLQSINVDPIREMNRLKSEFDGHNIYVGNVPPLFPGHLYGRTKWRLLHYRNLLRQKLASV